MALTKVVQRHARSNSIPELKELRGMACLGLVCSGDIGLGLELQFSVRIGVAWREAEGGVGVAWRDTQKYTRNKFFARG